MTFHAVYIYICSNSSVCTGLHEALAPEIKPTQAKPTNWHRRNPQENNCKGSPAPDEKRYSGCHWFSPAVCPAVCWTDSRSRGSRPRRTRVFQDGTEAALLVDASNAFNCLNREAALRLHNTRFVCPSISTMLINTYRVLTVLFMDGEEIYSREGTTQGDPLAMLMYAIATIPLIKRLPKSVTQIWYADDATALGTITGLRDW